MCIRDRNKSTCQSSVIIASQPVNQPPLAICDTLWLYVDACLLYTSDAADERSSVDLGGRRIIKKKNQKI